MHRGVWPEIPIRCSRLLPALALCGLLPALGAPARADERWLVRGLFDAELWETDAGSRLLSQNEGDPTSAGTLRLWTAFAPRPGLQLVVLGEVEGTGADDESGVESEIEQAFIRQTWGQKRRWSVDAGKLISPLGDFAPRYLPDVNPLIGQPSGYGVSYPLGAQLTGTTRRLDFRVAVVDEPMSNPDWVPEPDSALRPALAAGLTPQVGLRFGAYATWGPYLNRDTAPLPPGTSWRDLEQHVYGVDCQFSRGHFELHADYNINTYDAPTDGSTLQGQALYIEQKYTWSPRWFTAVRLESNEYPFIRLFGSFWVARETRVDDVELGAGYRFTRGTLLKLAYRLDRWDVEPADRAMLPDGHSVALQLSQSFDVLDWFQQPL
jgi:hypothetical protein